MKNILKFTLGLLVSLSALQAQAYLLTFDEPGTVTGDSAETFYASQGVTFSGGGLLADGASGGLAGQPEFVGGYIGTVSKASGASYSDSFFDIWIHFTDDVASASGDYLGNLGYGGTVSAYDSGNNLLGSTYIGPLVAGTTNATGTLGSFNFDFATDISKIHMISDGATAGTYLDNLKFDVPEPTVIGLFAAGIFGLGAARRKKPLFDANYQKG